MGNLKNRIHQTIRTFIEDVPTDIPDKDYNYVYPYTTFDDVHETEDTKSASLTDAIKALKDDIAKKQDPIVGGDAGQLMTWEPQDGVFGSTPIVKDINPDPTLRTHTNVPSERAVGKLLDTKADGAELVKHTQDLNAHLSEDDRARLNDSASEEALEEHVNDSDIHITAEEREAWNKKADQNYIDDHIKSTDNPHGVTAHQVGTYSRSEVDDLFATIRKTFFNYRNIKYDSTAGTASLVEYVESNWNPNYVLSYGEDLPIPTDDNLTYFALQPVTDYSTNESEDCMIYVKLPGRSWQEAGVQAMTPGDMVIRYPDTTMCVWIQGRFKFLFDSSSSSGSGNEMWRPTVTADGILGWTRSSETIPPDPISIKGQDGKSPQKGVDYFDGAPGLGVPAGGTVADIMVKTSDADYDTEWMSFNDFVDRYFQNGGILEGYISDWNNIQNKPNIYNEKGDSETDLVSQKFVSDNLNTIADQITDILNTIGDSSGLGGLAEKLRNHMNDFNNPHRVSAASIGAVPTTAFNQHTGDKQNPHGVTAAQLGLGNVDNTADIDKPISNDTKKKFDEVDKAITALQGIINADGLVSNVTWDPSSLTLTFTFRDESELEVQLPITDVFESMQWDNDHKQLVMTLPDGSEKRVTINQLITDYTGSTGKFIKVDVLDGIVRATIVDHSITGDQLASDIALPGSPTTNTPMVTDNSTHVATTEYVKKQIVDNLESDSSDMALSANMGRELNTKKASLDDVVEMLNQTPLMNITNVLTSTATDSALSANMGRELNLRKAPTVHTSSSGSTFGRATADLFGHARASSVDPLMDGESQVGTDDGYYARADHRHPTDTSRASAADLKALTDRVTTIENDTATADALESLTNRVAANENAINNLKEYNESNDENITALRNADKALQDVDKSLQNADIALQDKDTSLEQENTNLKKQLDDLKDSISGIVKAEIEKYEALSPENAWAVDDATGILSFTYDETYGTPTVAINSKGEVEATYDENSDIATTFERTSFDIVDSDLLLYVS